MDVPSERAEDFNVMRVVSVNVGLPRDVRRGTDLVRTGIHKEPIGGRVAVRRHNLAGDGQADLSVHGGPDKAVYAYPIENYSYWSAQLSGRELPFGIFGENLTVEGLPEDAVHIGDEWQLGSVRLAVTQPRLPCFKLGIRFEDADMVARFLASNRPGYYLSVLEEGDIGAGDAVEIVHRDENRLTVTELFRLMVHDKTNRALMQRALRVRHLAAVLRNKFESRLKESRQGLS